MDTPTEKDGIICDTAHTSIPPITKHIAIYTDSKINTKYVKTVMNITNKFVHVKTYEYIQYLHPEEQKKIKMDIKSRKQLSYLMFRLVVIGMTVPTETPKSKILDVVLNNNKCSPEDIGILKYILKNVQDMVYDSDGCDIENELVKNILNHYNLEEYIIQYITELYIMYITKFSKVISNFSWRHTKNITNELTNSVIRVMDGTGANPVIFKLIYDFGNHKINLK
jgi:hypothetical protein